MNFVYIFFIVLFTASCLYVVYTYYNKYLLKNKNTGFVENNEFLHKASTIETTFFFFHTDWCPHCKDAMSVWKDIMKLPSFKRFKTAFVDIDCEAKENRSLVKKYNVKEYPTFVLEADGKTFVYDANLKEDSLERFFVSVYEKL